MILATGAAVAWFVYHGTQTGRIPGGSSAPGLTYGIAGGVIMLFELLLWPRKHFRVWRVGMVNQQPWLGSGNHPAMHQPAGPEIVKLA